MATEPVQTRPDAHLPVTAGSFSTEPARTAGGAPRHALLMQTGRAALVITILSVTAAHFMAARTRPGAGRVATAALPADPETTGSFGLKADLRLDPCAVAGGR
ncbi:hypothetical protein [Methylobacterium sp. JK268]